MLLKFAFGLALIVSHISKLFSQEWVLAKSNEIVKVYTARTATSKFKMVKVEALISGTLPQLMRILKDVNNNKRWVYKTKQSFKIDSTSSNDFRYYAETAVPWPFNNRDMVIRMQFKMDAVGNKLEVRATGVPEAVPEKQGIVRIKKFEGLWKVKEENNRRLKIDYFLTIDPGGTIPAGISNLFASNGPFETFNSLSKLLNK